MSSCIAHNVVSGSSTPNGCACVVPAPTSSWTSAHRCCRDTASPPCEFAGAAEPHWGSGKTSRSVHRGTAALLCEWNCVWLVHMVWWSPSHSSCRGMGGHRCVRWYALAGFSCSWNVCHTEGRSRACHPHVTCDVLKALPVTKSPSHTESREKASPRCASSHVWPVQTPEWMSWGSGSTGKVVHLYEHVSVSSAWSGARSICCTGYTGKASPQCESTGASSHQISE